MGTTSPADARSLTATARTHLARAQHASHGRSAHTVHGGQNHALRQTLVALRAGTVLREHPSSRDATLQVLTGHIQLATGRCTRQAGTGDLITVPTTAHTLTAVEDTALLLTVSLGYAAPSPVATTNRRSPVYSWQEDWE